MRRLRRRLNRRFYRWLHRFYRAVFPTPPWPGRIVPASLRRVLLVRDDGYIGDMVVTTPLVAFLNTAAPHLEIDILASPKTAALLAADTRVTRVFANDHTWRGWLRVLRALRARRYDAVFSVIYGKGLREGLTASMIARRGAYKLSIWRPKRYRGFFTAVTRPPASLPHMADQLLYLGHRVLGLRPPGLNGAARYPMRVAVDDASDARAARFLAEREISAFIVVNLDSTDQWRSWRPEPCAQFVRAVLDRHPDVSVVLPPAPGKEGHAEEVARLCGSSRVIVARAFRVLELTALLARSLGVVTPNTGVLHLAVAVGRPIVALYTLQSVHVERWLPWGVPYRAVVGAPGEAVSDIAPSRIVEAFDDLFHDLAVPDAIPNAARAVQQA
jgi:ADP-heptose:LPS heptosyltransferase